MFSKEQIEIWQETMKVSARRATNLTVQQLRNLNDKMNLIPGVRLSETDFLNYVDKFFDLNEDDGYAIKSEKDFSDGDRKKRLELIDRLIVEDAGDDDIKLEREYSDKEVKAMADILVKNLERNNE